MSSNIFENPPPSYKETMMENVKMNEDDTHYEIIGASSLDGEILSETNQAELDYDYEAIIQEETYFQKNIDQNYPVKYVIADCVLMVLLNVSLIGLQVFAMQNDAALAYLGSALWAAIYNIGSVVLALLTIKYRNPSVIVITSIAKLFGMLISFIGFIVVNMVAFYHYNCYAASYFRPCYNKKMIPIHNVIIVLGIPCVLLNVGFFVYFQLKVMGRCCRTNQKN